jgi:hypothetical protein
MSSLQKFHRRTQSVGPAVKAIGSEAPITGSGFYLGLAGDGTSFMYAAPKSTEVQRAWGSITAARGATSVTDGLSNTNTLYSFGTTAHPAAGHCKTLTTGGYSTWYLPAINELLTLYSNKSATPFATSDSFGAFSYWSSTEWSGGYSGRDARSRNLSDGFEYNNAKAKNINTNYVRAVRRALI